MQCVDLGGRRIIKKTAQDDTLLCYEYINKFHCFLGYGGVKSRFLMRYVDFEG